MIADQPAIRWPLPTSRGGSQVNQKGLKLPGIVTHRTGSPYGIAQDAGAVGERTVAQRDDNPTKPNSGRAEKIYRGAVFEWNGRTLSEVQRITEYAEGFSLFPSSGTTRPGRPVGGKGRRYGGTMASRRKTLKKHRSFRRKQSKSWCLVYGLMDDAGKIRYIGQTRQLLGERIRWHVKNVRASLAIGRRLSPVEKWVAAMLSEGREPCGTVIDREGIWDISEAVWIDRHLHAGCDLLNVASRVRAA